MICDYLPMLLIFCLLAGLCAGACITWCVMQLKYRTEIALYDHLAKGLREWKRGTPADGS